MVDRRKHILAALFDIRPVRKTGDLDIERIKQVEATLNLRKVRVREDSRQRERAIKIETVDKRKRIPSKEEILAELEEIETNENLLETKKVVALEEFYFPEAAAEPVKPIVPLPSQPVRPQRSLIGFFIVGFLIALVIPTTAWLGQGLFIKDDVLNSSMSAYQNLLAAKQSLSETNWQAAEQSFSLAHSDFLQAQQEISQLGQLTLSILENLPGGDLVSSGSHLIKVGENLAQVGQGLTSAIQLFSFSNLFSQDDSLTDLMSVSQNNLTQALASISLANQELEQVKAESLPTNLQPAVVSLKEKLPLAEEMLVQAAEYSGALLKILGQDNPREYLLIFQNNSEKRATGGFIGTYGLISLDRGMIDNLFIDGVFNADGQLHEKIIPPQPIQKISTAWSMHDANWFADFPTSAQKISWFYEKTGGPTVDGVISITPTVIERLLELTGPITLPDYEVVLQADNFVEIIQYKVEVDYDKELNRPKQILADFTPKFIEALSQLSAMEKKQAVEIIFNALEEKHILVYFIDQNLENLAVKEGWSGRLLSTDKDYFGVVSSNINGYKTDRVVKETISHQAEIQPDGSIIDTLTITRQHQGGQEKYDWWNRVNANYLRVYLPKGSQMLSAKGQTLEVYQPPIDYQKQGFKEDPLVKSIESKMIIDQKTGTRIFEENNKTVFANWLYLSPGKRVTLTYQYKLPFKIDLTKSTDSYSLLAQKQSGSLASQFSHQLKFPDTWQVSWQYPQGMLNYQGDLKVDRFLGATFEF